ncbi:MAG TPA: DUF58 domain-containing protein [Noviherbaspirillum sp.]|uniref:DUF58 domain-containing protein n=1 Tax=Noviherbaspirillum sp. TaxID=1926288 RepID=UPI002D5668CA|nr:DUF58 domain-containing protein [Noviherbaspirillum sp.]HYD96542.1 DUF58 domain-containing protein [Noviherbaspirillum sp.]
MSKSTQTPEAILRRIELTVLRRLDGLLHGDYHTLFRGPGVDLADLREYQYHDDVRHIDWNVTARLQTPYVKEYYEERELTAWFLLDLSPSEDFGSQTVSKRTQAVELTTVLASMLNRHGNRFGALFYGSSVDTVIPPSTGRRQILQLMHRMMRRAAPVPQSAATRLYDLLQTGVHAMHRRSLVVVVSDFITQPGWERPLAMLAQRHDVIAVRLYDPLEMALPDLGLLTIQDAETAEQLLVDTHDKAFRSRFAAAVEAREKALHDAFTYAGVDVLELSTEDDIVDALFRFSELRRHAARLATGGSARTFAGQGRL